MEKMPDSLPEMKKQDELEPNKFEEKRSISPSDKTRSVWIVILACMLLVSFACIGWLLFSRRDDLKINRDSMDSVIPRTEEKTKTSAENLSDGVIVNDSEIDLTNYDSNITITTSGEHTLSGILNYSIFVDSDGPVTLKLNGITVSSSESSAITNRSTNSLDIILIENTTNTLTDGGESEFDGAIFSNGPLSISSLGEEKSFGTLIVSGRQDGGEGIATNDAPLSINSGKIMITSNDDGLNAGGDNAGKLTINGGILWIRAEGDGIDSNNSIEINGGNILAMSNSSDNSAIDSDKGVTVNGGNLVALGNGMLDAPDEGSSQKFLSAELNQTVALGSTVYVKNTDTNKIVNFKAESAFKTLVFSVPSLETGNYEISVDGQVVGNAVIK